MRSGRLDARGLACRLATRFPPGSSKATCVELAPSPDDVRSGRPLLIVDRRGTFALATDWDAGPSDRSSPFRIGVATTDPSAMPGGVQFDAAAWAVSLVQDRLDLPVTALRLAGDWPPGFLPRLSNAVRALRGRHPADGEGRALLDPERRRPTEEPMPTPADPPRPTPRAALDPATLAALRPHVFDLWDGKLSHGGLFGTSEADVERVFGEELPRRLDALPRGRALPVVLYAHGGLVSEAAGLQIAADQTAWWNDNGCYPLQFIWETGLFESIEKLIGLQRTLSRDLSDVSDALIERAAHGLGGVEIWGNMKNAAAAAFEPGAAGAAIVERLVAFARAHPDRVRLHAVGHSAGSIFHAHLLRRLDALDGPSLETLTFMAPAITVDAYLRLIEPLVPRRARRLRVITMTKGRELRDTVTPLYRKSLLYLIRNALEPRMGEPVLGLEESLRGDPKLVERFGLGTKPSDTGSVTWSVTEAKDGPEASASTSHGGFDNDVPTMNAVALAILGLADTADLPASFPPGTERRAAAAAPPQRTVPVPAPPAAPVPLRVGAASARRALCVGINAYPAPNALDGCVADSEAWSDALARLGFSVDKLQDAAATHAIIIGRLKAMVEASRAGDALVFQYAGHGTHVVDLDGDEPTVQGHPGDDQAICPVDFETGDLIIDDDLRAIFERLPPGAKLTCFLDSCHSGTSTRLLIGRQAVKPDARARYVKLSPDVVDRYVVKRHGVNTARALAGGRDGAGTREGMRWASFAACQDHETAWESDGHGDFSRLVVPLLRGDGGLTNGAFQKLVSEAFGPNPRQAPKLDCRDGDAASPFLVDATGRASTAPDIAAAGGLSSDAASAGTMGAAGDDRARKAAELLAALARFLQ